MPQEKNRKFEKTSRIPWDEFFMNVALAATERVACRFHKVASVFVDENHKIISIGYNGPSIGDYNCNEVGCAKVHGDPVTGEIKRCRGVHSEMNAIVNSGNTAKLSGSTLYITQFPCYDCMKALNNLGVKKIIYLREYLRVVDGSDGTVKKPEPEAGELAIKRGIICEHFRYPEEEVKTVEEKKSEENKKRF